MLRQSEHSFMVLGDRYAVRWHVDDPSRIAIEMEGRLVLRAPLASTLDTIQDAEEIGDLHLESPRQDSNRVGLSLRAAGNLWGDRRFEWRFYRNHIEYWHEAEGKARPGCCSYLGGRGAGIPCDTWVQVPSLYTPQQNFAARSIQASWEPARVHAMDEDEFRKGTPLFTDYPFYPPPFFVAFGTADRTGWLGIGLGAEPGQSQFTGFNWSGGSRRGAGRFFVDYLGYLEPGNGFRSPRLVIVPGYNPHEAMRQYVGWLESQALVTARAYPNAGWHRRPIFCGWGEQAAVASSQGLRPPDLATQTHYESWVRRLEELEIPFGTLVIDDKWMKHYGRWDLDKQKWPDLPGFIDREHAAGRKVLLWVPCWHPEGIPEDWCVRIGDSFRQADVSHPGYREFLAKRVTELVTGVGADGFKVDWIHALPNRPDIPMHRPCWGIERLHLFQAIVYNAAHEAKPDALIETQTPNPLFRDSSDMIRLNDLGFGMRNVTHAMRERARVARIAGWDLLDCDNASSAGLAEWREYMRAQPEIGVPSLYCITLMESSFEEVREDEWPAIRALWGNYLKREFGSGNG